MKGSTGDEVGMSVITMAWCGTREDERAGSIRCQSLWNLIWILHLNFSAKHETVFHCSFRRTMKEEATRKESERHDGCVENPSRIFDFVNLSDRKRKGRTVSLKNNAKAKLRSYASMLLLFKIHLSIYLSIDGLNAILILIFQARKIKIKNRKTRKIKNVS